MPLSCYSLLLYCLFIGLLQPQVQNTENRCISLEAFSRCIIGMGCPTHIHAHNSSSNLLWVKRMRAIEEIYDTVCP